MNLNTHSTNEPVIYNNYDAPLNGAPLGAHNSRPDFQSTSQGFSQPSNYFQLSSNERYDFLKAIGVAFPPSPYSMNSLVNSPALGHHYLSEPHSTQQIQVKTEQYEDQGDKSSCDEGRNATSGSYSGHSYENERKQVNQMYSTMDEYSIKQIDESFMESSGQQQEQQPNQNANNRSLTQKLVLAKINGSKYSSTGVAESKRGRGGGKGKRGGGKRGGGGGVVEYRVVKKAVEEEESGAGERMVVEPEYATGLGDFDRSHFEKTFANYSMVTTAGLIASRGRKSLADTLADGTTTISPMKKFPCAQCEKSFTLKQNLTYHVNSIHLGVRIKCAECDKSFAHKPNLIAHMQSAHNGVRFKCDHCVKSFNQKPNLISHIKSVHEGIKYKCEECTKTFAQKQNLLSHVQAIHMGIKYTCEICSKSYNQVSNLLSHMTTVHQAQKHKCADCGRLFAQEHTLRAHVASVHMDIVYEMGGELGGARSKTSVEVKREEVEEEDDESEEEDEFEKN